MKVSFGFASQNPYIQGKTLKKQQSQTKAADTLHSNRNSALSLAHV